MTTHLNLTRQGKGLQNGCLNIDPFVWQEVDPATGIRVAMGDHLNLNEFVSDNEAQSIIAEDILDFLDFYQIPNALKHWVIKLRLNGKLVVGGIDLFEVAKSLTHFTLLNKDGKVASMEEQIKEANVLLHNVGAENYNLRKNSLTMHLVANMLANLGLQIEKKHIDNYRYCIVAKRIA